MSWRSPCWPLALFLPLILFVGTGAHAQSGGVFYAVGDDGAFLRYTGTSWEHVATASPVYDTPAIWGRGPNDIYLVSDTNDYVGGSLYHFDGRDLTEIPLPGTLGGASTAWDVDGNLTGELVVGIMARTDDGSSIQPTVAHFDGSDWTLYPLLEGQSGRQVRITMNDAGAICLVFQALETTSLDWYPVVDIYEDGWTGLGFSDDHALATLGRPWTDGSLFVLPHFSEFEPGAGEETRFPFYTPGVGWDSLSWSGYCDPQNPGTLTTCVGLAGQYHAIWGEGAQDLWACGPGAVAHYDGASMSVTDLGVGGVAMRAIWGASNETIFAVGDGGTVVGYDGFGWSEHSTPTNRTLRDVWGYVDSNPIAVTVQTDPPGLEIYVDGRSHVAPRDFQSYEGLWHQVGTDSLQFLGNEIYAFSHWSDGGEMEHSVQIPGSATTYTAHFDQIPAIEVTVTSSAPGFGVYVDGDFLYAPHTFFAAEGTWFEIGVEALVFKEDRYWAFDHWSDGGDIVHDVQIPDHDITYMAYFEDVSVDVTVTTEPELFPVRVDFQWQDAPYQFMSAPGLEHHLEVQRQIVLDDHIYEFVEWDHTPYWLGYVTIPEEDVTYTAHYEDATIWVTVDTSPPHLQVTVDGETSVAPYVFIATEDDYHQLRVPNPQIVDGLGYVFREWSDGGDLWHSIRVPSHSVTYTAFFDERPLATVNVLSEPPGHRIQVGNDWISTPFQCEAVSGEPLNLNAPTQPVLLGEDLYYFSHWSDGGEAQHDVIVPEGGATYTAYYEPVQGINVTVDSVPPGLSIFIGSYDLSGEYVTGYQNTPTSFESVEGQQIRLCAISPQDLGDTTYDFASWSNGGDDYHYATLPFTDVVYTAFYYSELDLTLTVATEPPGLQVEVDGTTMDAPALVPSASHVAHEIGVASPQYLGSIRHEFLHWSDGGEIVHSLTMPDSNITATATFVPLDKTVTLITDPVDGVVMLDGVEQEAPYSFLSGTGRTHEIGAAPTLWHKGKDYVFVEWSDGGELVHEVVIPDGDVTYTAHYADPTAVDDPPERLVNALIQNHPNPFNPSTTIRFSLERAGHARLVIYDTAGRPVRTLVDRRMDAGAQAVPWDGRDDDDHEVASGVLYYRLEAGEFVQTKKMVLLR